MARRTTGLLAAGAVALTLAAAACGGSGPTTLTLSADGPAGPASVTYRTPDGERAEEVELPWELTLEAEGDFSVAVEVVNPGASGEVSCAILGLPRTVDATGEASASCRATVSSDGGSREIEFESSGDEFARLDGEPVPLAPVRFESPTRNSRAFVAVGDVGWSAEGGFLAGVDAGSGENVRTDETNGANGAAKGPDGTVYVAATGLASPHRVVAVRPDGLEAVFELGEVELDGGIVVAGDEVWVTTRDSRVLRLDAADGAIQGEIPIEEGVALVAGIPGAVAVLADQTSVIVDEEGNTLASPEGARILGAGGDRFVGVQSDAADWHRVVAEYAAPTFEPARAGSGVVASPGRIDVVEGVVVLGFSNGATLVDAGTLDPECTLETSHDYLGASDAYLWFEDSDAREFVLYPIADLGC